MKDFRQFFPIKKLIKLARGYTIMEIQKIMIDPVNLPYICDHMKAPRIIICIGGNIIMMRAMNRRM